MQSLLTRREPSVGRWSGGVPLNKKKTRPPELSCADDWRRRGGESCPNTDDARKLAQTAAIVVHSIVNLFYLQARTFLFIRFFTPRRNNPRIVRISDLHDDHYYTALWTYRRDGRYVYNIMCLCAQCTYYRYAAVQEAVVKVFYTPIAAVQHSTV